jgi:hypothetical protein
MSSDLKVYTVGVAGFEPTAASSSRTERAGHQKPDYTLPHVREAWLGMGTASDRENWRWIVARIPLRLPRTVSQDGLPQVQPAAAALAVRYLPKRTPSLLRHSACQGHTKVRRRSCRSWSSRPREGVHRGVARSGVRSQSGFQAHLRRIDAQTACCGKTWLPRQVVVSATVPTRSAEPAGVGTAAASSLSAGPLCTRRSP